MGEATNSASSMRETRISRPSASVSSHIMYRMRARDPWSFSAESVSVMRPPFAWALSADAVRDYGYTMTWYVDA